MMLQQLTMGNVVVEVLHTPGHTPEHICLLVSDHTRGGEPWMILTGHTLMVGDMGRTELVGEADEGARMLYETARRLRDVPDHLEVWPGACAGSVCGRALSGTPSSSASSVASIGRVDSKINQGLCWSTTAIMKIDLIGPDVCGRRHLRHSHDRAANQPLRELRAESSELP